MEPIEINYLDKLYMVLDDDCDPIQINCNLEVLGEGNNRIVYDLGNGKVLKVAKSFDGSIYNSNEHQLWQYLGEKSNKIKVNQVFEIDENGYWYVAEKVYSFDSDAMDKALEFISWLDYCGNAGYDANGKLTIVDAENVYVKDLEYLLQKGII